MQTWEEICAWRRLMRADLLAQRLAVPHAERSRIGLALRERIREQFPELRQAAVGFYWPINGEIDLRHLVEDFLLTGAQAALPVVTGKQQPLQFREWRHGMNLGRGLWNIPVPIDSPLIQPTALLVPLLGFDRAGYRLGYGGGYYDLTLAAMEPRPLTIGVGYELGNLETIFPQEHDIPLDAIVTESRSTRH